jgi:hypothetical protein
MKVRTTIKIEKEPKFPRGSFSAFLQQLVRWWPNEGYTFHFEHYLDDLQTWIRAEIRKEIAAETYKRMMGF